MFAGLRIGIALVAFCAVVLALQNQSIAQGRNCPEAFDQTVFVTPGQPVAFQLDVENLGDSELSIFQYPLGGVIQQNGSSDIEFTFVPQLGFNGTTEMTYRIIPPYECARTVQLGRVQFVGGFTDDTVTGLVPTVPHTLCGIGTFAPLLLAAVALLLTPRVLGRRRPS